MREKMSTNLLGAPFTCRRKMYLVDEAEPKGMGGRMVRGGKAEKKHHK
jgi:hypothetical protein